ncbi:hypothetical protein FGG08_001260 [Glutinoglossum americanum]|uniref:DUF7728 domain-containing protein n=1 Tax=Glutinoglossum americanum TaxID=1670608 RepID=A0A9P8IDU6_9PEZI|nr:hypothetical protein FGG08_001260 [Glutinoglossum americanum]
MQALLTMFFRSLILFSSLALTARGFLLPPSAQGDAETLDTVDTVVNTRLLKLDCPGCLFAESDRSGNGYHWDENVENSLFLNFTVERTNPEVLTLNGAQLYPIHMVPPPLSALQLPSSVSLTALSTITAASMEEGIMPFVRLRLSYELTVRPKRPIPAQGNFEILLFKVRILGIEGKPVTGLDTVEMTLLKSPENSLYIVSLDKSEPSHSHLYPSPSEQEKAGEEKECMTLPILCKWKAILGDKLSGVKASLKGCHKFRPGHSKAGKAKGGHAKGHSASHSGKPHGHHTHHAHHNDHRLSKFFRQLRRVAAHILVPIFIGVAAGMTASAIGMAAGLLVVLLWKKFYRGGNRGAYSMVQQSEEYNEDNPRENELHDDKGLPEYEEFIATNEVDGKYGKDGEDQE